VTSLFWLLLDNHHSGTIHNAAGWIWDNLGTNKLPTVCGSLGNLFRAAGRCEVFGVLLDNAVVTIMMMLMVMLTAMMTMT